MAKITGGILGGVSGAIGAVVGSRWKGIDTLRARVTPANPRTIAQTTQRGIFGTVSRILTQFLALSLRPILDPVAVKMSGFNLATKKSLASMGNRLDTTRLVVSSGPLDPPEVTMGAIAAGMVIPSWQPSSTNDPNGSDTVHVALLDATTGALIDQRSGERSELDVGGISVPAGATAANLVVLSWATRTLPDGSLIGSPTSSDGVPVGGGARVARKDTTF